VKKAMLKMGPKYTEREKIYRVKEILDEFNLEKCKNTRIGSYNAKRGISGGEKRRLAFASEVRNI
jgi:ATP-binding cassette, subfamily G (WHITE), eye pigment precursor transporter